MFSVIAAVLVLQGIAFFVMGDQVISGAFPALQGDAHLAPTQLLQVMAAFSIMLGLIAYAARTTSAVLWAFTIGGTVLLAVTLKHLLVDNIKVPIPALVIQILIVLSCGYLWLSVKKV